VGSEEIVIFRSMHPASPKATVKISPAFFMMPRLLPANDADDKSNFHKFLFQFQILHCMLASARKILHPIPSDRERAND
jgi:hypothetical protein